MLMKSATAIKASSYGTVDPCSLIANAYARCLPTEEAVQFLLARPASLGRCIVNVMPLLPRLELSTLIDVANYFDPSRPIIKSILLGYVSTTHLCSPWSDLDSVLGQIASVLRTVKCRLRCVVVSRHCPLNLLRRTATITQCPPPKM